MSSYYYRRPRQSKGKSLLRLMIFLLLLIAALAASGFAYIQYQAVQSLQSELEDLEKRFEQIETENEMLWEQYDEIMEENERLREENQMLRSVAIVNHGNRDTNKVAITIDDGSGADLINRTLDYFKEYNVTATLFPMGSWVDREPEVWRRAVEEGHELGNHTYSHAYLTNLTEEQIREELNGWQRSVDEALEYPYRTLFFRPPGMYGFTSADSSRTKRYQEIIAEKGMFTILWDVELVYALRNEVATTARITEHVLQNARGGSIVLLHFTHNDIAALPAIISGLRERGLEPCSLSELLLAEPQVAQVES